MEKSTSTRSSKIKLSRRKKHIIRSNINKLILRIIVFLLIQLVFWGIFGKSLSDYPSHQTLSYSTIVVDKAELIQNGAIKHYYTFEVFADNNRYIFTNIGFSRKEYSVRDLANSIQNGDIVHITYTETGENTYKIYSAYTDTQEYRSLEYWRQREICDWIIFSVLDVLIVFVFGCDMSIFLRSREWR